MVLKQPEKYIMKKLILLSAIALMIVASPVFAQKTTKKSFTNVKRINMTTASGSCEIRKGSGNSVEVEVTYTYDEDTFTPRLEQSGERLELGEDRHGRDQNGSSRWTISIPDGMKMRFQTGSGDLVITGVNIDINAGTGSGDLEFSNLKGTLDATTGSGEVTLANFNGEARVNTGSGDMDVRDSSGDIDMNCGSGDIRISQVKAAFQVNTGSGTINADKITIEAASKFNTGSGRAKVTLAATPKFDLAINSGSGDAELNFNGNEISGEIVMRASKRNGNISAPFEFDKTEEVDQGGYNNTTIVKTAQRGKGTNRISVSTGSGDATLKK